MSWTITLDRVSVPRRPEALRDARPLLARLGEAFGQRALGRFLGVGSGTVSNWLSGKRAMNAEMTKRVLDLHDVMSRALQLYDARVAVDWLIGTDPYLGGARPIDVLVLRGAGPVIEALEAHASFGYA